VRVRPREAPFQLTNAFNTTFRFAHWRNAMRHIHLVTVLGVILIALSVTYSQAPRSTTPLTVSRPSSTATEGQNESIKAKKLLVKELPKELKGLELVDGGFRLKPGYRFVRITSKSIFVALKNSARGTHFECSCIDPTDGSRKPAGGCVALTSSRFVWCIEEPFDECEGECEAAWRVGNKRVALAIF
jgi:hypothetical protein